MSKSGKSSQIVKSSLTNGNNLTSNIAAHQKSVVLFGESLNYYELAGIVLAVASLVLLMRFA